MEEQIAKHAKNISGMIAKTLGIEIYSLCFCGSGKKFKFCCYNKSGTEIVFSKKPIEDSVKYRDSQGGHMSSLPLGIFNTFKEYSISRLKCLYPDCDNVPVSCHLIPENILRTHFDNFCQEFGLHDGSTTRVFLKKSVNKAGALEVFCAKHDNCLFKSIDSLNIDLANKKQLFLLAFKTIAFSLRRVQWLLGIDSQAEIIRPIIISRKRSGSIKPMNAEIDISNLRAQYLRFCIMHELFQKSVSAYEKVNWDFFSHWNRSVESKEQIFFAGYLNPPHDLEGMRVNNQKLPIGMVCNIYSEAGSLRVILTCPEDLSATSYKGLIEQILKLDMKGFITVLNNIMTLSTDKPLIPANVTIDEMEVQKIALLYQKAGRAIVSTSNEVLNLTDDSQAVEFLKA